MKEYIFKMKGYDSNELECAKDTVVITAKNKQEAFKQAEKWCDNSTTKSNYNWQIDDVNYNEKQNKEYSVKCPKCGLEYVTIISADQLPSVCGCCATNLKNEKIKEKILK